MKYFSIIYADTHYSRANLLIIPTLSGSYVPGIGGFNALYIPSLLAMDNVQELHTPAGRFVNLFIRTFEGDNLTNFFSLGVYTIVTKSHSEPYNSSVFVLTSDLRLL